MGNEMELNIYMLNHLSMEIFSIAYFGKEFLIEMHSILLTNYSTIFVNVSCFLVTRFS